MTRVETLNDGIDREVLIKRDAISERVKELGADISKDYKGKQPLLVGILKGSFIFLADLARELDPDLHPEFDFMAVSSYDGTKSSRDPKIEKDLSTNISGRDVLLVEDIVDKGYSFERLLRILNARGPASLKTCVLLSKSDSREVEVPIDYVGFEIPERWVEGYGMDTDELYRNLPDIWARRSE